MFSFNILITCLQTLGVYKILVEKSYSFFVVFFIIMLLHFCEQYLLFEIHLLFEIPYVFNLKIFCMHYLKQIHFLLLYLE